MRSPCRVATSVLSASVGGVLLFATGAGAQVTSTSFQQGSRGYTGAFDRLISDGFGETSGSAAREQNGNEVASYYLDGYAFNASTGEQSSPDEQGLFRFDNIVGNGAGQIPSSATVLEAKLTLTTSLAGNAQTSGPFGVAGLNQAFDQNTSYFTDFSNTEFGSRGPWWQDGYATRPTGGYGFQTPGGADSANVASIVQGWADDPSSNFGLVVQAGLSDTLGQAANTSDGWSIRTSGFPVTDTRPKLEVTYTTAPVEQNVFQPGVNGYDAVDMAFVRSGSNALDNNAAADEVTEDGSTLDQSFLDGAFFTNTAGDVSSPDDFTLLKFNSVFGAGASQAPSDVPVAKAWLVLTTGEQSNAAHSPGPWSAYRVNTSWDTSSLHSSFGDLDGLQIGEGEIDLLDTQDGMMRGSEVWFDVTDYLEGVRGGATDHGLAVIANGTSDGWQIHATGSSTLDARPRLVVYSADLGIVAPSLAGDFNDDGIVDAADYTVYRDNRGSSFDLNGNGDETGGSANLVDEADYALWRANYGKSVGGPAGASAAPEPAGLLLLACGLGGLTAISRR